MTVAPDPNHLRRICIHRALRRGARVTVARVSCPARCRVELAVADGHRTLRRQLHTRGSFALAIVRGSRLRPGLLRVRVRIDGRLFTG